MEPAMLSVADGAMFDVTPVMLDGMPPYGEEAGEDTVPSAL